MEEDPERGGALLGPGNQSFLWLPQAAVSSLRYRPRVRFPRGGPSATGKSSLPWLPQDRGSTPSPKGCAKNATKNARAHASTHALPRMHAHTHTLTHAHTHTCARAHMHTRTHTHTDTHTRMHKRTHAQQHTCTHAHTLTRTRTRTRTPTPTRARSLPLFPNLCPEDKTTNSKP